METTFLYEVRPKGVITGLDVEGVNFLRVPKSLFLTKEDVKKCLPKAAVYRRFANEGRVERVDIGSVDRFHNEKYMTEEEYAEFLAKGKLVDTGKVEVTETVEETAAETEEESEVVEETHEETSNEEVNDEVSNEDEVEEATEEVEETEEETDEEESEVETTENVQINPNFKYNGKKKHKK